MVGWHVRERWQALFVTWCCSRKCLDVKLGMAVERLMVMSSSGCMNPQGFSSKHKTTRQDPGTPGRHRDWTSLLLANQEALVRPW